MVKSIPLMITIQRNSIYEIIVIFHLPCELSRNLCETLLIFSFILITNPRHPRMMWHKKNNVDSSKESCFWMQNIQTDEISMNITSFVIWYMNTNSCKNKKRKKASNRKTNRRRMKRKTSLLFFLFHFELQIGNAAAC